MADAEAFLLTGGLDLGLAHTDDGDGVSHGVEDFQFIAGFLAGGGLVLLDYGGKVPPAETEGRNVLCQDDVAEEFVFHGEDGGGTLNVERRTLRGQKGGVGGNHEWHEGHEWEDGMGRGINWLMLPGRGGGR